MKLSCLFFLSLIGYVNCNIQRKIYVFGDSHASFCFTGAVAPKEYEEVLIKIGLNNVLIKIYWLGPITMNRVGRDKLNFLDLRKYNVNEDDICFFCFGEIDIRCHVIKQRDKGRSIEEIINTLVKNYLDALQLNRRNYKNLLIGIVGPMPPHSSYNPEFPIYGSMYDRIKATKILCEKLEMGCKKNNLLYIDLYSLFRNAYGSLGSKFSSDFCHVDPKYNYFVKKKLINLISSYFN